MTNRDVNCLLEIPLRQHPAVAALGSKMPPHSKGTTLRAAIGIIDEFGECSVVLVRLCDPLDVLDHKRYWPLTISDRWRLAMDGVTIVGADNPPPMEQWEIIVDIVRREVAKWTATAEKVGT